jgi:Polyketide cyclase / dehydrase and lipid transport
MATIRSELKTRARADEVWSAVRDIGALHTRLVPGFVVDTKLEPGARIVTFVNGVILREPIVTLDDQARRLVWTAEGGRARHYNAALEVSALPDGLTSVVWTADFLPDELSDYFSRAIEAGMAAMQVALDKLAA